MDSARRFVQFVVAFYPFQAFRQFAVRRIQKQFDDLLKRRVFVLLRLSLQSVVFFDERLIGLAAFLNQDYLVARKLEVVVPFGYFVQFFFEY